MTTIEAVREQTRARYPDEEGYVERDGVRIFYEVYGSGEPTVLLDVGTRADAIRWVRPDLALIDEEWWRTRRTKTWAVDPSNPGAPQITTQPAGQTVGAGQTASFSITTSGTAPLSYQWQKNGTKALNLD